MFEIVKMAEDLESLARDYKQAREISNDAETNFKIILASKQKEYRKQKANAGLDVLILMLLEEGDKEVLQYYTDWKEKEATYKGLEHLMNAVESKINAAKLIMKLGE